MELIKKKLIKPVLQWFRLHKGIEHRYTLKALCQVAGISKQALWKYEQRQVNLEKVSIGVIKQIEAVRKDHPRMSCRKIYTMVQDSQPIGRDIFEQIGFANGYKLRQKRNYA